MTRITGKVLADWGAANYRRIPSVPLPWVSYPPVIPDAPDELVIVTITGGAGHAYEKAFEVTRFQIRCRAIQNRPEIAEANSLGIDRLLNTLVMPWKVGPALVIDLGWIGGGPAPMPNPDDAANRYSWVCNYFCRAATEY